jgi:hypothetical protein
VLCTDISTPTTTNIGESDGPVYIVRVLDAHVGLVALVARLGGGGGRHGVDLEGGMMERTPEEVAALTVEANRRWREAREADSRKYGGCEQCLDLAGPTHGGSSFCQSGSIASGGHRAHCTCDWCF